jgi:hypothetical protein
MYKLILGIIIILGLQASFQVYNAVERTDIAFASIERISEPQLAPFSRPVAAAEVPETGVDLPRSSALARPQVTLARHSAPVRSAARLTTFASAVKSPRPRTQTVERRAPALPQSTAVAASKQTRPRLYDGPSVDRDQDGKGSFVAKVVKKPYEWLKTVGSKLF